MRHRSRKESSRTARQHAAVNYRGRVSRMSDGVLMATLESNSRLLLDNLRCGENDNGKARYAAVLGNEALRRGLAF